VKKNPHAVPLGRLGGVKAGLARAAAAPPGRRGAARARWAAKRAPVTASDAPTEVRQLLKSYDRSALRWSDANDRYEIVREILVRGDSEAKKWLRGVLDREQVRQLVKRHRGAGCNEPQRAKLRRELRLSVRDIPRRAYLGFYWRSPA
jgi:hypothetical protein